MQVATTNSDEAFMVDVTPATLVDTVLVSGPAALLTTADVALLHISACPYTASTTTAAPQLDCLYRFDANDLELGFKQYDAGAVIASPSMNALIFYFLVPKEITYVTISTSASGDTARGLVANSEFRFQSVVRCFCINTFNYAMNLRRTV